MTISYNWLQQYLTETISADELSYILTSVGLEVESMEAFDTVKGGLQGLVIGEVKECLQHPNADKLRLTKVDTGGAELLSIVCGAPNVATGQKVIVAPIGATIYPSKGDALEMKKAKIRGEWSEGMICAEDEIGLGDSHDGIMILPSDTKVGMSARDYFQLPASDIVYEIGLTPNRMDAMSHIGVAKDVVCYLKNIGRSCELRIPETNLNTLQVADATVDIRIETELCKRYAGVCLSDITVQDSPEWLQQFLKAIGLRPVNNIVDITNYVLHECGQPLHAFDLQQIIGNAILVKTIADKTPFTLLDGKQIELHEQDLMICNSDSPMCIAGVYGGLHSGVKDTTTSIFLESAYFDSESIRKTSVRHGLRTDAATRFEKGADISKVIFALQRAAQLMVELCGARIASPVYDVYPSPVAKSEIVLSYKKVNLLAGKNYAQQQVKTILQHLQFDILSEQEDMLTVAVPFSNPDITMAADVVEEIMRIDGLDNIPFTGKISYSLPQQSAYKANAKQYVSQQLVAKGFYEIFTNSITHAAHYNDSTTTVKMMNSLSAHLDVMRESMLHTGMEAIAYNLNRKNSQLKFFEIGKTYHTSDAGFVEKEKLALYVSGHYRLPHYTEKEKPVDVYYLRGIVESIFYQQKLTFEANEQGLTILYRNQAIGTIEMVQATVLKSFDIKQAVAYAELDWSVIKAAMDTAKISFKEIPKFPNVQRDLAMVVKKSTRYADIQTAVKQAKSKLLQNMNLFDVFESEKIGKDNISYAVNFTFYDAQKTLTDVEIEQEMKGIISSLEKKVGAVVRS